MGNTQAKELRAEASLPGLTMSYINKALAACLIRFGVSGLHHGPKGRKYGSNETAGSSCGPFTADSKNTAHLKDVTGSLCILSMVKKPMCNFRCESLKSTDGPTVNAHEFMTHPCEDPGSSGYVPKYMKPL